MKELKTKQIYRDKLESPAWDCLIAGKVCAQKDKAQRRNKQLLIGLALTVFSVFISYRELEEWFSPSYPEIANYINGEGQGMLVSYLSE